MGVVVRQLGLEFAAEKYSKITPKKCSPRELVMIEEGGEGRARWNQGLGCDSMEIWKEFEREERGFELGLREVTFLLYTAAK